MFPLAQRIVIPGRDFAGHINAGLGGGVDYHAVYVPLFVSHDGIAKRRTGPQGGLQFILTRPNGDRIESFHLKSIGLPDGPVKEGQLAAITGNSGLLKPGAPPYVPHLHLQIFNKAGVRLDPEKYDWGKGNHVQLVNDKGTVYLVTGVKDKRKIGLADLNSLGLFGDEPQEPMDTSGIPQYNTIVNGTTITH